MRALLGYGQILPELRRLLEASPPGLEKRWPGGTKMAKPIRLPCKQLADRRR